MKQAIFTAVMIAATLACWPRSGHHLPDRYRASKQYGDSIEAKIPDARQLLLEIMNVTGLQPNFELKEAAVRNIQASISHRKRYILYNPSFVNKLTTLTNDKWAVLALLAHEVGHHLNGHTIRKTGSRPALELEADEFAGFILYKLGASLEQSQEVIKYIADKETSATHPGRDARLLAIQHGWNKAATGSPVIVAKN